MIIQPIKIQWISAARLLSPCFNEAFVLLFGNFCRPTSLRIASVVTWSVSWMLMQDTIYISVTQGDFEVIWYSQSQSLSLKICRFGPISVSVSWVSTSSVWATGWRNGRFGFDSRQSKTLFLLERQMNTKLDSENSNLSSVKKLSFFLLLS